MAGSKPKITLSVTLEQKAALRQLAADHGLITTKGTEQGKGSISALVKAIADGHFTLMPVDVDAIVKEALQAANMP